MLIDRATIFVRSGRGGDGCVSLRREKFVPRGGPDGGDGGRGGDVVLRGDRSVTTLLGLSSRPHLRARHGQPGMGRSRHGADGADLVADVPLGTLVFDHETGELLADITEHGQRWIAAAGGRGGFGNEHFKSATNQTPREATPGEPMVERVLRLELKLIADVGLIGKPNAGKSTMLRAISRAQPKVADYPFTTKSPHLGLVELPGPVPRRMVFADIPGLIEGAGRGAGLGHDFLRHVERTRVLLHLLDVMPLDGTDAVENYRLVRGELAEYAAGLARKPEIVVLNKIDVVPEEERAATVERLTAALAPAAGAAPILVASGATRAGLRPMLEACWSALGAEADAGWNTAADRVTPP